MLYKMEDRNTQIILKKIMRHLEQGHNIDDVWVPNEVYEVLQIEIEGKVNPYPKHSNLNTLFIKGIEIIPYNSNYYSFGMLLEQSSDRSLRMMLDDFILDNKIETPIPFKSLFEKDEE